MEDLTELRQRLRTQRPVPWEQLPDFALYMDQVLSYMDRQVIRFDEDDGLTSAMVNNYTKSGLVPRAAGKKYNREHLAYLTAICVLKRVMSTRDMDLLIKQELQGERSVANGYAAFCESLDKALNITADEMELLLDTREYQVGLFALLRGHTQLVVLETEEGVHAFTRAVHAFLPGLSAPPEELAARLLYQISQQELTLKKLMKCSAPALQTLL